MGGYRMTTHKSNPNAMLCPIGKLALTQPDATAILTPNSALTYACLDKMIGKYDAVLREKGVQKGKVVATTLPPSPEYVTLLWAVMRLGAIAAPLNPNFPPAFLAEQIEKISPAFLIKDLPPILDGETPNHDPVFEKSQLATIILTSGSGGAPKAAVHRFGNHIASALSSDKNIPLEAGDAWLLSLPLYHISGLATLFRCFVAGATLAIPENRGALEPAIECMRLTHLSLVPTQLQLLLENPSTCKRLQQCKAILLGGSAIPESLLQEAISLSIPLHTTYGLTEMSSQVCTTPPNSPLEVLKTSGKPLLKDSIKIGAGGVIMVAGECLFAGYWNGTELVPPPMQGAYFPTGDLGRFDESGCLRVLGRRDNMFISGGENIQPETIEHAACQHPDIHRAVCVPVPDNRLGFVPALFVKTELDQEEVLQILSAHLPKCALPKHIGFMENEDYGDFLKINRSDWTVLAEKLFTE